MKALRILLMSGICILPPVLGHAQYIPSLNGVGTNTTVIGTFTANNMSYEGEPGIQIGPWPGTSAHFLIGGTNNSFGGDPGNNDLGQGQIGGNYNGISDWPGGHQVGNYLFGGMSNLINAPSNYGYSTNVMIINGFANYLQVASGSHDDAIAFSTHSTVNDAGYNSLLNIIGSYDSEINAANSAQSSNDLVLNGVNSEIIKAALATAIGENVTITNNSVFFYSDGSTAALYTNGVPVTSATNNETVFFQRNGFCINTNFAGPFALNVNGSVNATSFNGNGSGLTDLIATNLIGGIPPSQLPADVTFNNLTLSGPLNMGSPIITSGGATVFDSDTNTTANLFVGYLSGFSNSYGSNNTAVGYATLYSNTSGCFNTVEGAGALANAPYSFDNIAIGFGAGSNFTNTESQNIDIGNPGYTGDSGITRIGEFQTATYLAGNVYASGAVFSNGVDIVCDRNAKENFSTVDAQGILKKVASLPLMEWNYKTSKDIEHMGPMAQDFHAAFGLNGGDDKHISVVDEGGVALAAIQGLNQELQDKDAEIRELQKSVAELNARVAEMSQTKANQ